MCPVLAQTHDERLAPGGPLTGRAGTANGNGAVHDPFVSYAPTPTAHVPVAGLTADLALEYLAYAEGNPALAAERLGLKDAAELLGLIALDETVHPRAQAVFRFMQLAKLLGALSYVEADLLEKLERMDGKDVARLYGTLVQAADLLTRAGAAGGVVPAAPAGPHNLTVNLLRMLPAEVRDAVRVLMPPGALGDVPADAGTDPVVIPGGPRVQSSLVADDGMDEDGDAGT